MALGILVALVFGGALAILLLGCGGSPAPVKQNPPPPADVPLTKVEVMAIVQNAALAVDGSTMAIAVVDRRGDVLAVYNKPGVVPGTTKDIGNFGTSVDVDDLAVALARTAAYFSNDQAPLSSRTVRFISGIHFPPGVDNAPTADLYGIENTNRGCTLSTNFIPGQESQSLLFPSPEDTGPGILTGKSQLDDSDPNAVNPGGVPIFRGSLVVGGIGVAGVSHDAAEFAAVSGAKTTGFSFIPNPYPTLARSSSAESLCRSSTTRPVPAGASPGTANGNYFKICPRLPVALQLGQPPDQ